MSLNSDDYRKFFELSPVLFMVADFEGNIVAVNAAWESTLGYSQAELTGRKFAEFVVQSDKVVTDIQMDRSSKGEDVTQFENRYVTKAGDVRWLRWRSSVDIVDSLIFGVASDISREKETQRNADRATQELELSLDAEQKLKELAVAERNLYENLITKSPSLAAMLRGPRHVFEYANDRYKLMIGNRGILGKALKEAIPMCDPKMIHILDQVYLSGRRRVGIGTSVAADWLENGTIEVKVFDYTYEPMFGEDSKPNGVWVWAVDVTASQQGLHGDGRQNPNTELEADLQFREGLSAAARILVVDDQSEIANALMTGLHEHQVESCTNFTEAIELLDQSPNSYDLILCELNLEGLTSETFFHMLLKQMPSEMQAVAVMSAGQPSSDLFEWLGKNRIPHLQKPFKLKAIKDLIAAKFKNR